MCVCVCVCVFVVCVSIIIPCVYYNTNIMNVCIIRRHGSDVYLGMCPVQNGVSYLNVLARFSETSQTAVAKNNLRPWIGFFGCIEDGSAPKGELEYT